MTYKFRAWGRGEAVAVLPEASRSSGGVSFNGVAATSCTRTTTDQDNVQYCEMRWPVANNTIYTLTSSAADVQLALATEEIVLHVDSDEYGGPPTLTVLPDAAGESIHYLSLAVVTYVLLVLQLYKC